MFCIIYTYVPKASEINDTVIVGRVGLDFVFVGVVCVLNRFFFTVGNSQEVDPPAEGEEEPSNGHAAQSSIKSRQTRVQEDRIHSHGQTCKHTLSRCSTSMGHVVVLGTHDSTTIFNLHDTLEANFSTASVIHRENTCTHTQSFICTQD